MDHTTVTANNHNPIKTSESPEPEHPISAVEVTGPPERSPSRASSVGAGERVCRICHMPADAGKEDGESGGECERRNSSSEMELIELGCACKDEMGISHHHCAQAWFTLKGNRKCEICGKLAKNIQGIPDVEERTHTSEPTIETDTHVIPMHNFNITIPVHAQSSYDMCRKSTCNILLALLVILFVCPWLFNGHRLW